MKKFISLVAVCVLAAAGSSRALAADVTPATPPATPEKKADAKKPAKSPSVPYKGEIKAADNLAKTFTIGERVFGVTSTTKIEKAGQPAVFADLKVGEKVTGSYKKTADGKLEAASVYIGGKTAEPKPKAPTKPAKDNPKP